MSEQDTNDEDYARDVVQVTCEECGRDVDVTYAEYDALGRCWYCEDCQEAWYERADEAADR